MEWVCMRREAAYGGVFFVQEEEGIRDEGRSRGCGEVYKGQGWGDGGGWGSRGTGPGGGWPELADGRGSRRTGLGDGWGPRRTGLAGGWPELADGRGWRPAEARGVSASPPGSGPTCS
ncbi:hypothetical protein AML91_00510 [Paenibacillus jilunlii]|uniref:Uncharacterized protein n=1 Tax=Paenibacillus jilunlii TaxID=682956 RepID=A0ABR5T1M0_9BACL|nr:hypothetical protein AML91_00510 [Paenibacillus jilunlii]